FGHVSPSGFGVAGREWRRERMETSPDEVVLSDQILFGVFPSISADLRRYSAWKRGCESIR
ncbi:hypothetical protein, partial [Salinibacter altiplanensis]|uniref:hypothetical protein n=1 Tax=Salinibacter altiplanensis TaxID=1803181 RepID=UPI001E524D50